MWRVLTIRVSVPEALSAQSSTSCTPTTGCTTWGSPTDGTIHLEPVQSWLSRRGPPGGEEDAGQQR
jgi:hypothetical protein